MISSTTKKKKEKKIREEKEHDIFIFQNHFGAGFFWLFAAFDIMLVKLGFEF
jgi:hypothetical protein